MAKLRDVLGINARSNEYLKLNSKRARKFSDDKLLTKRLLVRRGIPHPRLLEVLSDLDAVRDFNWMKLTAGFVLKPVQGLGGDGVMIIKKQAKYAGEWLGMSGEKIGLADLRLHTQDIVEGRYSRRNVSDSVMIEERVKIHPKFIKLAVKGTPDVRVMVFNRVPVMAMLRLPTAESKGKANLHQGAVGLGIDIATGITTFGVYQNKRIKYLPGKNKKVNGISVPFWRKTLLRAIKSQIASRLGYVGVDLLLDKERGPLVIEFNDQPGLAIQTANMAGLRRRLDRISGLEVDTAVKGVKIGKALFASRFASRVRGLPGERRAVGIFETAKIKVGKKRRLEVPAKIDTGAYSTSIDRDLAREYGLLHPENILWEKQYRSALGNQRRQVIQLVFWLRGKKVVTRAGVTDRPNLRRKLLIGRRDLRGFVINPGRFKPRDVKGKRIDV